MRDDFPTAVKDVLAKRVALLCSNPGCKRPTSGPHLTPARMVNIGVAAHITAASPAGPRYDETVSTLERGSIENGIWLCQSCAKLVDSDETRYQVEKLREWKSYAESAALIALTEGRTPTGLEGVLLEAERLMPQLIDEMRTDVRGDASELVREFVVLSSGGIVFPSVKSQFRYYKTDHPDLDLGVDWLRDLRLVVEVSRMDPRVFRMSNEFVSWLRG